MSKKLKKPIALLIAILLILLCNVTALAKTETSVDNNFETGVVDISIAEYQNYDDVEQPLSNIINVIPGQYISQIPRITNYGVDCYIRAKLECDCKEIIDTIELCDNWQLYDDGYYYYKSDLKTEGSVDMFTGFTIPVDLSSDWQNKSFDITITADAIQSTNFNPDWDLSSPWGQVDILACNTTGPYNINTVTQVVPLSIVCDDYVKTLITNLDDFFSNFGMVMPGDVYTDSVEFNNTSDSEITVYFRQEVKKSDLLDKVNLKISADNKVIYDGTLGENIDELVLMTIDAKTSQSFDFEVNVPKELNNDFALRNDMVKWYFSVDSNKSNIISTSTISTIQTGTAVCAGIVLAVLISGLFVYFYYKKRERV